MRSILLLALLFAGCVGQRAQGAPGPEGVATVPETCSDMRAELWVQADYELEAHDYPVTSAEMVERGSDIYLRVSGSAAKTLLQRLGRIASHPCQEARDVCDKVDARLVARISGNGCGRTFVATPYHLVDLSGQRFGTIGQGFRDIFGLNVEVNCDEMDAGALLRSAERKRGTQMERVELREWLGPMRWREFERAKPELAHAARQSMLPVIGLRAFYYIRLGMARRENGQDEEWLSEAIVTRDDCSVLRLQGNGAEGGGSR